ncbi:hypothetical protein ACI2OX_07600 [Bacillus sp. N9]
MTLENDDKTYDVEETLIVCEQENIPMVLDYHHYMANKGAVDLSHYLPRIFNTWNRFSAIPKFIFRLRNQIKRIDHMLILSHLSMSYLFENGKGARSGL